MTILVGLGSDSVDLLEELKVSQVGENYSV